MNRLTKYPGRPYLIQKVLLGYTVTYTYTHTHNGQNAQPGLLKWFVNMARWHNVVGVNWLLTAK